MRRVATIAVFVSAVSGSLHGQSGYWRAGERVVLSDFSVVTAVAASPWMVFAATTNGLIIYDRSAQGWLLPQTLLDGYPITPVRIALADAVGNGVWLGTLDGWAHYDQDIKRWDGGILAGGARDFFLDSQDQASGIYVLGLQGWSFIPRGSSFTTPVRQLPPPARRIVPLDLRSAFSRAPLADAMRARILTDARLRTYQYTTAAGTADRPELYFGTNGLGLIRFDPMSGQGEAMMFGLPNARASAVAAGSQGVWVVGSARAGERRGVTWITDDLSRFTVSEDALGRGTSVLLARRLLSSGDVLWLASDHGAYRIPAGGGLGRLFNLGSGLPSEDVLSLAPAPDGAWIGTAQGLAVVTNGGQVVRINGYDRPVTALVAERESLWVGTADGLAVLAPGAAAPSLPPELAAQPSLRAPIAALALLHDTVVVATADQLGWRDPGTGAWTVLRPRAPVGTITTLAADPSGVWIGGTGGVAYWDIARSTFRGLSIPSDVPAAVRDLAVEGDYLWIATDAGLVRFNLDAARRR
jgi:hypothetical protein